MFLLLYNVNISMIFCLFTDERLDDPPQGIRKTLVVRDGDGKPSKGPPDSALFLCVLR